MLVNTWDLFFFSKKYFIRFLKADVFLSCALLLAEDQTLLIFETQQCTFTMSCDIFFFYHNKCLLLKQYYG